VWFYKCNTIKCTNVEPIASIVIISLPDKFKNMFFFAQFCAFLLIIYLSINNDFIVRFHIDMIMIHPADMARHQHDRHCKFLTEVMIELHIY